MTAIPFDTLKMAERLESAGFSMEQAKMQAALLAEAISAEDASIAERFSSKPDLSLELTGIRSSIERLDAKIDRTTDRLDAKIEKTAVDAKANLSEQKAELVRWVVGVGILQMTLIAGLVVKLVH